MGDIPGVPYDEYVEPFNDALVKANCLTVDRAAHFIGQTGHESGGLQWLRELNDGSDYEGRTDIGNTQPGDGVRFAGRGIIQLTGRDNYAAFSRWAHQQGLVDSQAYFVDHPDEVEKPEWAFLVASYYWTVARDINPMADEDDLEAVTRAVNGGTRGINDRRLYLNRAKDLGDKILPNGEGKGGEPVANWWTKDLSQKFWEHGAHSKSVVVLHTTENDSDTPAENVANYQLDSKTGSYHALVDDMGAILRCNTNEQMTWSCGNYGNNVGLNLSFVSRAAWSRAEWLKHRTMLKNGAKVVAEWCEEENIPKKSITPEALKGGTKGITDHNGTRIAWGGTTHTDVGEGFPWDVFVKYVNEANTGDSGAEKPAEMKTPQKGGDMTDEERKMLRELYEQFAGPNGDWKGWPAAGDWDGTEGRATVEYMTKMLKDIHTAVVKGRNKKGVC